jgi:hypothetical protein
MKLSFCAVCGTIEDLQQHHIDPVVMTGAKRKKNKGFDANKPLSQCTSQEIFAFLFSQGIISSDEKITVCSYHHNILHGIVKFQRAEHTKLVKEGQQKAREKGVHIGRPTKINDAMRESVNQLRENGKGIKNIAKDLNIGIGTVYSIIGTK